MEEGQSFANRPRSKSWVFFLLGGGFSSLLLAAMAVILLYKVNATRPSVESGSVASSPNDLGKIACRNEDGETCCVVPPGRHEDVNLSVRLGQGTFTVRVVMTAEGETKYCYRKTDAVNDEDKTAEILNPVRDPWAYAHFRETSQDGREHAGVDFKPEAGEYVHAGISGKAKIVRSLVHKGLVVMITPKDTSKFLAVSYHHLSELLIEDGNEITAGQALGKLDRKKTTVHVGVIGPGGEHVDPCKFLFCQ